MHKCLTNALIVLIMTGIATGKYPSKSSKSSSSSKPPPDMCKDVIDPYRPDLQKGSFFRAAGSDNELTEAEFNADRARSTGFARRFDSWRAILAFDKDGNKTIDWLEADAYRYSLRKRILASCDVNGDGKLSGRERIKANSDLARGRIPSPGKSSGKSHAHSAGDSSARTAALAERSRLKSQLEAIRRRLYYSSEMAAVRKAYDSAEKAYSNAKNVPAVAAARKPYYAAKAAYEAARDRTPQAHAYEKAKKIYYDAYRKTPEYKAYYASREKLQRTSSRSSSYRSARAAYEVAKKRYETMKTEIPEYRTYREARETLDDAAHSLIQYKKAEEAEDAYKKAYQTYLTAERKVKDKAREARDDKLESLMKADSTAVGIYKRIKQIDAKYK